MVCDMAISFFMVFSEKQEFSILMHSGLSTFSFMGNAFDVNSKKTLPNTNPVFFQKMYSFSFYLSLWFISLSFCL